MSDINGKYSDAIHKISDVIQIAGRLNGHVVPADQENKEIREYILRIISNVREEVFDPDHPESGRVALERRWTLDSIESAAAYLCNKMKEERLENGYCPRIILKNSEEFIRDLHKLSINQTRAYDVRDLMHSYSLIK